MLKKIFHSAKSTKMNLLKMNFYFFVNIFLTIEGTSKGSADSPGICRGLNMSNKCFIICCLASHAWFCPLIPDLRKVKFEGRSSRNLTWNQLLSLLYWILNRINIAQEITISKSSTATEETSLVSIAFNIPYGPYIILAYIIPV